MQLNIDLASLNKRAVFKVKNDVAGHEFIANLRAQSRLENAKSKAKALLDPSHTPVYVKIELFGRLGKNNPKSWIYKQRNKGFRNGYQRIALADASEIAIYVNPMLKNTWGYTQTSTFNFVK